jgi:hypothetical protein
MVLCIFYWLYWHQKENRNHPTKTYLRMSMKERRAESHIHQYFWVLLAIVLSIVFGGIVAISSST